jgi:uncharacterized membrane protein
LYLSEAVLLWFLLGGLSWCAYRLSRRLRLAMFPSLTDGVLARFLMCQVLFVAVWSVVFKLLLPRDPNTIHFLSTGGSQYYANGSEMAGMFLIMIGACIWFKKKIDQLKTLGSDDEPRS